MSALHAAWARLFRDDCDMCHLRRWWWARYLPGWRVRIKFKEELSQCRRCARWWARLESAVQP